MGVVKKTFLWINVHLALAIIAGLILPVGMALAAGDDHKPITRELMELVEKYPEIHEMLSASIAEAKKINPDFKTNPVQSFPDYCDFIDTASELIPQDVLENPSSLQRDQILQSICYFYFLIDQPLPQLEDKELFKNSIQFYEPFSTWLRDFANTWGSFLDTEASWDMDVYRQFYDDPRFGLQMGWYESPTNWNTFNQFFARNLKSPEARPVSSKADPSVVVSPADSVPHGIWAINGDSKIRREGGMKLKLATYYNIKDLLGEDSRYKDAFAGGVLTHTFLNVNDYHHYHFAVGGTVKEMKKITQNTALEVKWSPEQGKYIPIDSMGWQFSHTRGYVIVDTGMYGLVALIPMGMAQVSSVNFEENIKVGTVCEKGDRLGWFLFGGSDFVMLFQKEAGFKLTAPLEANSDSGHGMPTYKHILMGEVYGVMIGLNR